MDDDIFWIGLLLFAFLAFVSLMVWADISDERHDDQMKQQYIQCQAEGKEWVLTKDNGSLDGVCVTKK